MDIGTLSPLLKRMEKKQLITRTRDAGDERTVNIAITGQGTDGMRFSLEEAYIQLAGGSL